MLDIETTLLCDSKDIRTDESWFSQLVRGVCPHVIELCQEILDRSLIFRYRNDRYRGSWTKIKYIFEGQKVDSLIKSDLIS